MEINSSRISRKAIRDLKSSDSNDHKIQISKNDLLFKNRYNWKEENTGHLPKDKSLDNAIFNRHQGNEVLFMINKLMDQNNLSNVASGQKIEAMLLSIPNRDQSHQQVKEWVLRNWDKELKLPENIAGKIRP